MNPSPLIKIKNLKKYKILLLIFLVAGFFVFNLCAQKVFTAKIKNNFPKRANYYLAWTVDKAKARELAKWDLVVLDAEVQERTPESIKLMRQLNPDITILAYITSQDIRQDAKTLSQISPLRYKRYLETPESWYLKNSAGQKLSWWPGTYLLNVSRTADYTAEHVVNEILSTKNWDGIFYDNSWQNITYFAGSDVDINLDGKRDTEGFVNAEWQKHMKKLFKKTRALAKNKIVLIGNGDSDFTELNGIMYENFPRYGWKQTITQYLDFQNKGVQPNTSIINSNTNNVIKSNDYQMMRYGLASALMGDGFYSFDDGDQNHTQIWWYDEYETFLGEAKSEPYQVGEVWRRDFSHGTVVVNTASSSKTIVFDGEFEQIHGKQDSSANSGRIVSSLVVPAKDGRILMRRVEKFFGTAFDNGAFARVFNKNGEVVRNGFFAYDPKVRGGMQVLFADLEGDGKVEKIVSDKTYVYVYEETGELRAKFAAYAETYTGGVTIAVGQVTGSSTKEIITGTRDGGGPHVRVFSAHGRLLNGGFFAFHPKFRGGVNITIGDTNGNGLNEIIVGAGVGGGPHVQIFSADGRLLDPGFFPYQKSMRGGVRVAAADVDGDGIVEIVTGPGPGVNTEIFVFNSSGEKIGEGFKAFSGQRNGVYVAGDDLDGDGKDEILVLGADVFTASFFR